MKKFVYWIIGVPLLIIIALIIIAWPKGSNEKFIEDEHGYYTGSQAEKVKKDNIFNSKYLFFNDDKITVSQAKYYALSVLDENINLKLKTKEKSQIDEKIVAINEKTDVFNEDLKKISSLNENETVLKLLNKKIGDNKYICIGENQYVLSDKTSDLITSKIDFITGKSMPYKINSNQNIRFAFCRRDDEVCFEIESNSGFLCFDTSEFTNGASMTLLNSDKQVLKYLTAKKGESLGLTYKGSTQEKYYIVFNGDFNKNQKAVSLNFPKDANEFNKSMIIAKMDDEYKTKINYFGDEDYIVLPNKITKSLRNGLVCFSNLDFGITITAYDRYQNPLGRCLVKKGKKASVSFNLVSSRIYAISVCATDGKIHDSEISFYFDTTDERILGIETYGFKLSETFDEDKYTYYAYPQDNSFLRINSILSGVKNVACKIDVEEYCGYKIKRNIQEILSIGYGTCVLNVNIKVKDEQRTYKIIIVDKRASDYNFALLKVQSDMRNFPTGELISTLQSGTKVYYLNRSTNAMGTTWIKVQLCSGDGIGKVGFVKKSDLFYGYPTCNMPASYVSKIGALKAKHPNWKFKFVNMQADFNSYAQTVASQTISNTASVSATNINNIKYYLDPRNFLNEQNIFMFANLKQTNLNFSIKGINAIWNKGSSDVSEIILNNYKEIGMNPYFIASRAAIESGYGSSALARGAISGYEGYYNFFGIGAVDSNAAKGGGSYAKRMEWNTKEKSIIGGAKWIRDNYVEYMQSTPYFFRFFTNSYRSWHIYMSDLSAPLSESKLLYNGYLNGNNLNDSIEFIIPVYSNMP